MESSRPAQVTLNALKGDNFARLSARAHSGVRALRKEKRIMLSTNAGKINFYETGSDWIHLGSAIPF